MRSRHPSDAAFEEWVDGIERLRTHSIQAAFRQGWNVRGSALEPDGGARSGDGRFKPWAQMLLSVSEYVGPFVGGVDAWLCAFGCGGHSFDGLEGVTTPDGGYRRTPPASRDWHNQGCPIKMLVADLADI